MNRRYGESPYEPSHNEPPVRSGGYLTQLGVPRWAQLASFIILAIIVIGILFAVFTTRVDAGQGCLLVRFGKVEDGNMGPGLHYYNPFTMDQKCMSTLVKTYELVNGNPNDSNSAADYKDWAIDSRTSEGIQVWTMLSVQYHIPVENVGTIYANVAKSDERVQEQVVKYWVRALVPQLINTYEADALFFGDLPTISAAIRDALRPHFDANGVVLDNFELKRGDFEDGYENSIREQGLINQNIERELLNQSLATEQAETNRISANGVAEQERIRVEGVANQSVITQDAANQNVLSAAAANADAALITAQAESESLALIGNALTENPALLERERYQIIAGANVVYLPSETLGFLDIGRAIMPPVNQDPPSQENLR